MRSKITKSSPLAPLRRKARTAVLVGVLGMLGFACRELPTPESFRPYEAIPIMPNDKGYIAAEDNRAGIQGQWYSYAGLDSVIRPRPLMDFSLSDGKICTSGTASAVEENEFSIYYGAGIGFHLCYSGDTDTPPEFPYTLSECPLSPLSPEMHTRIAGIDFDLEMNGDDHPEIRVIFREWRREESPYVKIENPGNHRALFKNAGFWDYTPEGDDSPSHPGEIHSILFQIPTLAAEERPFDFCISNLQVLVNPTPETDTSPYEGTDTWDEDAGAACAPEPDRDAGLDWVAIGATEDDGFEILRTEVTAGQYAACKDDTCCSDTGNWEICNVDNTQEDFRPAEPANCVNWYQARAFCRWAGGRLPTETEWNRAAGNESNGAYPWGAESPTCERAVMAGEGERCRERGLRPAPVCSTTEGNTPEGLCDMAGNVWEWIEDFFPQSVAIPKETFRMLKGGSYFSGAEALKIGTQGMEHPAVPRDIGKIGFRCVRD